MSLNGDRPKTRFRKRTDHIDGPADPEALFGDLPRTPFGVGALWSHQADQLREYAQNHRDTADVALELPTGSGKTLVGLLVAEWRRRALGHRVVYACPTKQLARQVADKAEAQGIRAALLIDSSRSWDPATLAEYTRADSIAITTYSAIFNTNSRFSDSQTLIFDDAHAAEGYVAEAWALTISSDTDHYARILDCLTDDIDQAFFARMVAPDGPAADETEIRLLPVTATARKGSELLQALSGLEAPESYRLRMVGQNLAACLFYVSRKSIYIRPMLPPTFQHSPFTSPSQRVYLSATLGDAGELERSFGRSNIAKVAVPPAWERTGSGRRFFVFPELSAGYEDSALAVSDEDDNETLPQQQDLVSRLMSLAEKRLILTPDNKLAGKIADKLGIPEKERFDARDASAGISPFLKADRGTLLAPSRYDGMDLADDSCHLTLMASLPAASHLQDRFFETKLRAVDILQERIRTRVIQGTGRCTRGPRDWSVVIILGEDLLRFLSRLEVRQSLPAELQAEIEFGFAQGDVSAEEIIDLADSALTQDIIWREDAEPELARLRRAVTKKVQPNAAELAASAHLEVRAWSSAWQLEWEAAGIGAAAVLETLTQPTTRPYRALWAYLASAWFALAADTGSPTAAERSTELRKQAQKFAVGTTWLKEVEPVKTVTYGRDHPDDRAAAEKIANLLAGAYKSSARFARDSSAMLVGLAQSEHRRYEVALAQLGVLIGAESYKPPGKGRADAVWLWPEHWLTIEAKSEQTDDGVLSLDYVRQTNTQLRSLAADRVVDTFPEGSSSIIVTPRAIVDPDGVPAAELHLYTAPPRLILDVAHDATRAWKQLRGVALGVQRETLVEEIAKIMWDNRVLPTQVRERLTRDPIRVE